MTKEVKPKRITREQVQRQIDADYEYDHESLTGKFLNLEHKGRTLDFRFKKYRQDDYKQYSLKDGAVYTLPRMVVQHLKENVYYKKYKELKGLASDQAIYAGINDGQLQSQQSMAEVIKDHRCDFIPLDFKENERLSREKPKIIEVVSSPAL
jgi:hypothetical protein